jgi:hypothetical protein
VCAVIDNHIITVVDHQVCAVIDNHIITVVVDHQVCAVIDNHIITVVCSDRTYHHSCVKIKSKFWHTHKLSPLTRNLIANVPVPLAFSLTEGSVSFTVTKYLQKSEEDVVKQSGHDQDSSESVGDKMHEHRWRFIDAGISQAK